MQRQIPLRPLALLAAAALVPVAEALPISAAASFYLTALALAGVLGVGFAAYLTLVERPRPLAWAEAVAAAAAVGLLGCDCAVRFPDVVRGAVPAAAQTLGSAALAACALALAAGLLASVPLPGLRWALPAPLRALLSRS